jgi:hypothetical protein
MTRINHRPLRRRTWIVAAAASLITVSLVACTTSAKRSLGNAADEPSTVVFPDSTRKPDLVVYFRADVSLDQINEFLTPKRLARASIIDGARIDSDQDIAWLYFRTDASAESRIALRDDMARSPLVLRVE